MAQSSTEVGLCAVTNLVEALSREESQKQKKTKMSNEMLVSRTQLNEYLAKIGRCTPLGLTPEEMQDTIGLPDETLKERFRIAVGLPAMGYEIRPDGLTVLTVTSHGHNGPEQQKFLKECGHMVTDYASEILNHGDFTYTEKGAEIQIGILTHERFKSHLDYKDLPWTPGNAWKFVQEVYGIKERPFHDIGVLLRKNLSDDQMESLGLWGITTLSEPIKDSDGDPCATGPDRDGGSELDSWCVLPDRQCDSDYGFSFVLPQ